MSNRIARSGPSRTVATVAVAVLCLGAVTSLAGCDLNYQPACLGGCAAGGGDETYSAQREVSE